MSRRTSMIWTFAITSVALFMTTLDNLVVTTALPVIHRDLHASLSGLEWTVNAYTLTFAVFLITGAALGDRFGRRRMFVIGLAIFTAGSAAAALAPSIEVLIAARAVQGFGGAIVLPLTLTILSAAVPAERRGLALGAWGGISGLAVAIGPLVGGAVVQGISWQWIFWLNVPIGLALIPLAALRLKESRGPNDALDLPGVGLASVGLFGIVWGLVRGNSGRLGEPRDRVRAPRRSGRARAVRALGAPDRRADAAAALLPQPHLHVRERRVAADVLRDVRLDLPAGAVLPDRAGLLAAAGRPADPAVDGDADLRRADRRRALGPHRRPAADGHRARAAGGRARLDRGGRRAPTVAYSALVVPFILSGVGMALYFAPVANVVLSSVRPEEEGQASGANNAIRELGGVFGVAVLASVFAHYGGYGTGQSFVDGLGPALYVGAAVVAAGAVRRARRSSRRGARRRAASAGRGVAAARLRLLARL